MPAKGDVDAIPDSNLDCDDRKRLSPRCRLGNESAIMLTWIQKVFVCNKPSEGFVCRGRELGSRFEGFRFRALGRFKGAVAGLQVVFV